MATEAKRKQQPEKPMNEQTRIKLLAVTKKGIKNKAVNARTILAIPTQVKAQKRSSPYRISTKLRHASTSKTK